MPPKPPGRPPYVAAHATIGPGDTVVLHTDGLVERRGEIVDTGLDRLAAAAAAGHTLGPAGLVDVLLDREATHRAWCTRRSRSRRGAVGPRRGRRLRVVVAPGGAAHRMLERSGGAAVVDIGTVGGSTPQDG